ncbi:MAG: serine/threonine protein kinase [Planctomycetaceae bacterium]|nr:serine/threonine protein kinase [Planctomycetaceae bacterium]
MSRTQEFLAHKDAGCYADEATATGGEFVPDASTSRSPANPRNSQYDQEIAWRGRHSRIDLADELGWGDHDGRGWMATLDAETRHRLAQIPTGWSRFSTCQQMTSGGCGKISVSNDGQLNRQVVIKKINPELLNDRAVKRFLNEARITAQLEHPGIAPVYELGIDDQGLPFYAMKQLSGQTLAESLAKYVALPAGRGKERTRRELLHRFLSVCQTVAFAHQRGVIHRDLKPDNIMLGQFGETTVVDWGLARTRSARESQDWDSRENLRRPESSLANASIDSTGSLTVQGMVMGTAAYMSPEQAQGLNDRVDHRSDVFSLGVILFELLNGRSPFVGSSMAQTIDNVIRCNHADLSKRLQGCSRRLAWICLKAMAAQPVDRYQSVSDMAHDIESYLAGQPLAGRRESAWERFDRWAGHHRSAVRGMLVCLLVGFIALTIAVSLGGIDRDGTDLERPLPNAVVDSDSDRLLQLEQENERLQRELLQWRHGELSKR